MAETSEQKSAYGKRPLWQWIALYVVIGAIIYGAFYYFILAKKGSSPSPYSNPSSSQTNTTTNQTTASKNEIAISNFTFSPASLTVKVGDSVTWTNQDSMGHSVTADDSSFDTGVFTNGESKTVTFSKAGTYTYHCSVHPNMHGTIVVQ